MLTPVLAFTGAWLSIGGGGARKLGRLDAATARTPVTRRLTPSVTLGLAVGFAALIILGPGNLGWAVAGGVACGTAAWVVLARLHAGRSRARAREVAQAARLLASLLRSGQIPAKALQDAAEDFPLLARAAAAARLGGDVATALRQESEAGGAGGLRAIAAAWEVSHRSGAPVATVLQHTAEALRDEQRVVELVENELASARTSGHIMAVLPFGALVLGFFAGVNPVEFILGSTIGQMLSTVAVTLTACGIVWIERLARR